MPIAVLRYPILRASYGDFELEEDKDKVASLPAIMKLLITCHLPLSPGLHTGCKDRAKERKERKNYGMKAE